MGLRDAVHPVMAMADPPHRAQAAAAQDLIADPDIFHGDLTAISVDHRAAQKADRSHELARAVHEARRIGQDRSR